MRNLKIAVLVGLPLAMSCMDAPLNGTTFSGTIAGTKLGVAGYSTAPNSQVYVQVLKKPQLDVAVDSNWVTLAITYASSSAVIVNGDSLYHWQTSVTPVPLSPTAAERERWPDGGLVKLRSVVYAGDAPYNTLTFDAESWTKCSSTEYFAGTPGKTIGTVCQGLGRNVAALVSTLDNPADVFSIHGDGFLAVKGDVNINDTDAYYTSWGAPSTLNDFKSRYEYPGTGDVTATYYNDGDLGIAREMHCWKFIQGRVGTACYVSNYSDTPGQASFGHNDPAAALTFAVNHTGAFATVAMATEHAAGSPPGPVNFVVYDEDGNRVERAQLDNAGSHESVPNNCLTCHGIDSRYDSSTHTISGRAAFLPFDPSGYKFTTLMAGAYTRSAQEEAFRRLNQYVLGTTPPAATVGLIDGAYQPFTASTPGATWNDDWIPDAWKVGSPKEDNPTLYNAVVKPYCRTCHVSAGPARDFAEASDFDTLKAPIIARACGNAAVTGGYFMPQAEHPFRKFWESGARAYLNAWGGDPEANGCKPLQ